MNHFTMNGIVWQVVVVPPNSGLLVDRLGTLTVAVTDPMVHTIYMSSELRGQFRRKVLTHELCHCALVSYNLLDDIHRAVRPSDWIVAEEWVCNLLANYGVDIFSNVSNILSDEYD